MENTQNKKLPESLQFCNNTYLKTFSNKKDCDQCDLFINRFDCMADLTLKQRLACANSEIIYKKDVKEKSK